jgi:hypothetical protein
LLRNQASSCFITEESLACRFSLPLSVTNIFVLSA